MTTRQMAGIPIGLVILSMIASGCASARPTEVLVPTPPADIPSPTSSLSGVPAAAPEDEGDRFLFVEVIEEQEQKTDTGRQTTSFVGGQTTYSYNPETGKLVGPLAGVPAGETAVVVGYVVITQIDRNRAASGALYVLPEGGGNFGLVVIEGAEPDGSVRFTYAGGVYTLEPGESVQLEVEARAGSEGLPVGQAQHVVTVTNHGFLPRESLTIEAP